MTRAEKLLALGCDIARRELELDRMRATFRRMVDEIPFVEPGPLAPRTRGRPATWAPIKQRVLEVFAATDHELPAGEIVHRLKTVPVEVVHTTLSKLAHEGRLVRVRWGVYRRA